MSRPTAGTKRAEMLRAARTCISNSGFTGATVAAIARESDVSVGSVYSYFDNREQLLVEAFQTMAAHELDIVRHAVTAAGEQAPKQLDALVDTFAYRALRGRRLAWALLFEPVLPGVEAERFTFRQAYRELGKQIIRDGIDRAEFIEQDIAVSAAAVMGAISESLVGVLSPLTVTGTKAAAAREDRVVGEIRAFCRRAVGVATTERPARTR